MIVLTADQVDSRSTPDLVGTAVRDLNGNPQLRLVLPAERTAGDEIQLVPASGVDALAVILQLTRTGRWSVGCGVGPIREPLPASVRESAGEAFIAARHAVERAKKRPTRFALDTEPAGEGAQDVEALLDLLLVLRDRRSDEGWQLHDLLVTGMMQAEAASALGISPQAASKRAQAAELRAEEAVIPALARLIDDLDRGNEKTSS
ncbi:MAG: DNA-binding protein [Microbacteriaceae bacterium]|jgi:hypothetical protein|nr:DNA-binding protein [Microbacteriaceae bacterium]HEV7955809.1 DNA-binding protein [Marisediminicola sp.]